MILDDFLVREFGYAIAIVIAKLKEAIGEYKKIDISEGDLINLTGLIKSNKILEECSRFGLVKYCKDGDVYKDLEINLKNAHYVKYTGFIDDISGYYIKHPEYYTKKVVVYVKLLKELGIEKAIIATQVYIKYKQTGKTAMFTIKDLMDLVELKKDEVEKILEELQRDYIIDYTKVGLDYFIVPDENFIKILKKY